MRDYRKALGKVEGLQRGFTSGTSAQAAARGAVELLLSGTIRDWTEITLRGGLKLRLPLVNCLLGEDSAECGVIKDSGDDDDITHGHEFRARARWTEAPGIEVLGGKGVGRVTREGLAVPPGQPAINPVPMKIIRREIEGLVPEGRGLEITLSVPDGEQLAAETWNPRLGIEGGISILGTSGIVEPKDSSAYKASIALSINVRKKAGDRRLLLTPGYVGEAYLAGKMGAPAKSIVKVGDHIGYALEQAAARGFEEVLLAGHIGKMVKLAAGVFNTHSKYADARLETLAALAAAAGASRQDVMTLLDMKTAEEAVPFLQDRGLQDAFSLMNLRLLERIVLRLNREIRLCSVIIDLKGNLLSEEVHG
jgi:cobalt-precorrin-5B (C1)-methyltransferase